MTNPPPPRVRPRDISDLLAWATSLTAAPHTADPAQWAAYLTAKADLLTRIADHHTHDDPDHAHQIAANAHAAAQRTATLLPTVIEETP